MILADNETRVDLLNNEAIATTIVKLLRDQRAQPVTVGVHGDWGAGKSSVLEMIEAGLAGDNDVLCLKFNGWRFQGFEDAKIALIEGTLTPRPDVRCSHRLKGASTISRSVPRSCCATKRTRGGKSSSAREILRRAPAGVAPNVARMSSRSPRIKSHARPIVRCSLGSSFTIRAAIDMTRPALPSIAST